MSALQRIALWGMTAMVIALLLCGLYALQLATLPVQTPGQNIRVTITPGQNLEQIASMLQHKGVIASPFELHLVAQAAGLSTKLQAGEFEIHTGWTRLKILRTLAFGPQVMHVLRIPEGLTWWETADIVAQSGLTTFDRFKAAIHDRDLLDEFDIPADSAEGYLFPETYKLAQPQGHRAEPIVRLMLRQFRYQIRTALWPGKRPDPKRVHRLVILASLVEKETGRPKERPLIAGVFTNRLEHDMRLQCDPTVIYGLGRDFDGNLTKADLEDRSNPYNTYTHVGLPPGPICSPGLASLQAAKNPKDHNYLYFVSKGDGSHRFSRNLREHNQAVRRFQKNGSR